MIKITITQNEEKQRLDRFLKKYLRNAPLSYIYKLIRKNVKVNGKRGTEKQMLENGDEVVLYISEEEAAEYQTNPEKKQAKRQFRIAYEDEHIIAVEKPSGLLTHGTKEEKKNTLANQVISYLIEKGDYRPSRAGTFVPSPANRLDRNTSGLVLFGKNYGALKALNELLREQGGIEKYYLTIAVGRMTENLHLVDRMEKQEGKNRIKIYDSNGDVGKRMETWARPLAWSDDFTLVEVQLITGRTHQIRAHLAKAGHPIIGDDKYGSPAVNRRIKGDLSLMTQFLHAYRLVIKKEVSPLEYLSGKEIISKLPDDLKQVKNSLFPDESTV